MALPRELRDMVYKHIVDDLPKIINVSNDRVLAPTFHSATTRGEQMVLGGSTHHPLVTFLPGIAYVNDNIYKEFVPMYLPHIYLNVNESPDLIYLESFFDTLPRGKGWNKINNMILLDLASISRTPGRAKETMDTILQAVNLQVLILNFKLQDFYLPPEWPFPPQSHAEALAFQNSPLRSVDAAYLMTEYQFDRLFELQNLKKLVVKIEHGYFEHTPRSVGTLADLRMALMEGLQSSAPNIKEVLCQEVDVRSPGISVFILSVERC
jgi:hypothetical protein